MPGLSHQSSPCWPLAPVTEGCLRPSCRGSPAAFRLPDPLLSRQQTSKAPGRPKARSGFNGRWAADPRDTKLAGAPNPATVPLGLQVKSSRDARRQCLPLSLRPCLWLWSFCSSTRLGCDGRPSRAMLMALHGSRVSTKHTRVYCHGRCPSSPLRSEILQASTGI